MRNYQDRNKLITVYNYEIVELSRYFETQNEEKQKQFERIKSLIEES